MGFVLPFLTVCEEVLSLAVEVDEVGEELEPLLEVFCFVFAFTSVKKEDVEVPSIINIITATKNIVPGTIVFIVRLQKTQDKKDCHVILNSEFKMKVWNFPSWKVYDLISSLL